MLKGSMVLAAAIVASATVAASADTITKNIEVNAPAAKVWSMIGGFCSIDKWHPAIGKCTEDGKAEPTRQLTTKDGKAHFEEKQTARDDSAMMYSYEILKSPLPIKDYKSTLKVISRGADMSEVVWSSTFTPDSGKEKAADEAIGGIYTSGLDNIKATAK